MGLLSTLRSSLAILSCLLLFAAASSARGEEAFNDPVFDVKALATTPLDARVLKRTAEDGIVTEEVMYHSEMDGDKSVDIFACFCYPEGAKKLPAFIWNQSGCYQASTYFPLIGAKRGYAVLCIDFPIPGYRSTGGYLINSDLTLTDDPKQAPIYHGAVALIKAVTFLQSREEVDPDRIGMAGSSWGGFFTTLMIGVDPRLKAGSAMFGCGALQLGNAWWDSSGKSETHDAAFRERWATTLDPAYRLKWRTTPMAWFTGTDDTFYWMPALMESYARAAGPKHLTILPNWDHGLTKLGDGQVFAWLDVYLKGGAQFVTVGPLSVREQTYMVTSTWAKWSFSGTEGRVTAEVALSYGDAGNWVSRYWIVLPASVDNHACDVQLPDAAPMPYFIVGSVVDEKGYRYSTPLLRVDPKEWGRLDPQAPLDYNGCSVWGGFEPDGIHYMKALGYIADPKVSDDAKEGKQSLVVSGALTLHAIYYTQGVPHRFTAYMKSQKPVDVTIELVENYGAHSKSTKRTFAVGTGWTPLTLDHTPEVALWSQMTANITLPEGASALLDDVSFSPIQVE